MASKVIKGGGEEPTSGRVNVARSSTPPSDSDVLAEQMVQQAQLEARAMMRAAESDAAQMIAEATERGTEEGRQSASEFLELAERLGQQLSSGLEREALEAAVEASAELFGAELKHRPRAIVDVVRNALQSARHQREIYVRVNPKDAAMLRENKRELLDVLSRAREVDIREDALLAPGGCMIETEIGIIDAKIETQLDTLGKRLFSRA